MEHTKHLWRAIGLIVIIVAMYIVGRVVIVGMLYPTFGEYGPYRGDALSEEMALEVRHGTGQDSCAQCHEDRVEEFSQTAHASINCETCHAPLASHVHFEDIEDFMADPGQYEWSEEMAIQRAMDLCIRCHEAQAAKPHSFPQVAVIEHLEEMETENSPDVCLDCHDPHDPSM
jgi:hypothetical protein